MPKSSVARALALTTSLSVIALAAQPALAQDAPARPGDVATSQPDADIIVTARKRDETLISVPVTVSAMSPQMIERYRTDDLSRIGDFSPGVSVGVARTAGGGTIGMRGINSSPAQVGFEQAVSVATDGVQSSDGRVALLGFFDLQQIEVMKGPQALFFGKNSPAGVIALTSAGPTPDLQVTARAGYEFVGREAVGEVAVSGPLSDTLGFRIAGRYSHIQGWVINDAVPMANPFYNPAVHPAGIANTVGSSRRRMGVEQMQARLTLKFQPADNFTATLKVLGSRVNDAGNGVSVQSVCDLPRNTVYGVADPTGECRADNHISQADINPIIARSMPRAGTTGVAYGHTDGLTASFNMQATFGAATFTSVTGYNYIAPRNLQGNDQTGYTQIVAFADDKVKEFSQEIRMLTDLKGPVNFMVGGYYQHVNNYVYNDVKVLDSQYNPANGRFDIFEREARQKGTALSVFGQVIINLSDQFELTGGARWSWEKKAFASHTIYGVGTSNTVNTIFPGSNTPGVLKGTYDDDDISPEATLSWHPDRDKTVYVSFKTGYKSGGFAMNNQSVTTTVIGDVDFGAEDVKGFEVGAKGLFLNRRLRVSAAAFAFDFKSLQVNTYNPLLLAFTISNAGAVRQRGFEAEFNYDFSKEFSVHGAVTYAHNRFKNFTGACYIYQFPTGATRATAVPPPNCRFQTTTNLNLEQVFDGRAPARSPDWTANAGFVADVPLGDLKLGFTGDAVYNSGYYASETMSPLSYQNDFWKLNGSVTLSQADDRWQLALIGRNLTNKYIMVQATDRAGGANNPGRLGIQRANVARGREVTLQATMRF